MEFDEGSDGWLNAVRFDQCFQSCHCGNTDWNAASIDLRADKLYGWIATEDDYNFEGIVGLHLRKCRNLKSVSDITEEEDTRTTTSFLDLNNTQLMEMHLQVEGCSLFIDNLMKEKDGMIQCYNEEMRKNQLRGQKHLESLSLSARRLDCCWELTNMR